MAENPLKPEEAPPSGRRERRVPIWMLAIGAGGIIVVAVWAYRKYTASKQQTAAGASGTSVTSAQTPLPTTTAIPLYQDTFTGSQGYQDILNAVSSLQHPYSATPSLTYKTTGVTDKNGNSDTNAIGLATIVYGLKTPTEQDATLGAAQLVAANPQVNWANGVPAGTIITVPERVIAPQFATGPTEYNQGGQTTSPAPPNYSQNPATLQTILSGIPGMANTTAPQNPVNQLVPGTVAGGVPPSTI